MAMAVAPARLGLLSGSDNKAGVCAKVCQWLVRKLRFGQRSSALKLFQIRRSTRLALGSFRASR
jgi:hypothetical protein